MSDDKASSIKSVILTDRTKSVSIDSFASSTNNSSRICCFVIPRLSSDNTDDDNDCLCCSKQRIMKFLYFK
jgi:hypothetical protein